MFPIYFFLCFLSNFHASNVCESWKWSWIVRKLTFDPPKIFKSVWKRIKVGFRINWVAWALVNEIRVDQKWIGMHMLRVSHLLHIILIHLVSNQILNMSNLNEFLDDFLVKSHNMIYRYDFTFDWYNNNAFLCIRKRFILFFFNKKYNNFPVAPIYT